MQTTLTELLGRPEGQRLDFKRAEIEPVKALRAVCAFANTSGGYLVLGVDDDRRVRGVPDIQGLEER